ncbi:MAG: hypothetical protein ABGW97_01455 [Christiangramia sp.]|uniref:hypothetical protein n=1 Tax=Christiangramia sp. TaxID=1931228 RepID=UPI00324278DF
MFILLSIPATLAMTLFSYVCGRITGHQFREPQLLNHLIRTSVLKLAPSNRHWLGWLVHFLFGIFFAGLMLFSENLFNFPLNVLNTILIGFLAGILGIIGWQLMFFLNPDPPKIHLRNFYLQLIVAHIIFTSTVVLLQTWE